MIEVVLLCLAGYVLSRAGVTDKATQRKLNVINVSLFTPALLFSKVCYRCASWCPWCRHENLGGALWTTLHRSDGSGCLFPDARQAEGDVDYPAGVSGLESCWRGGTEEYSFVLVSGLSAVVAWTLAKIFKLKRSQRYVPPSSGQHS